jgi:hypothetical protein
MTRRSDFNVERPRGRKPSERKGRPGSRPALDDFDSRPPGLVSPFPSPAPDHDPDAPHYIAVHEAGHAVAAIVLGLGLRGVHIRCRQIEGRDSVGFTDCPCNLDDLKLKEEVALPWMVHALAGPVAEWGVNPRLFREGKAAYAGDVKEARLLAVVATCDMVDQGDGKRLATPEEQARKQGAIDALVDRAINQAHALVAEHWDAIRRVAALLLEREALTAAEVAAAIEAGPMAPA